MRGVLAAGILAGIVSAAVGAPAEDDAWRKEKEALWDRLWQEGKTVDEIEAEIARVEAARAEASLPPPASLPEIRKEVDPRLADDISQAIPADYKEQAVKFRARWDDALRQRDNSRLQDYVLASIVHFAPPPETERDWLARAGLDEKALLAWVRSQIRCPVLQAAADGGEHGEKARSHLASDLDGCPRCAGSKRRLLSAYVDTLVRLTDPERRK